MESLSENGGGGSAWNPAAGGGLGTTGEEVSAERSVGGSEVTGGDTAQGTQEPWTGPNLGRLKGSKSVRRGGAAAFEEMLAGEQAEEAEEDVRIKMLL